jgi:hypothetical protein
MRSRQSSFFEEDRKGTMLKQCILIFGAAQGVFAQTTGPTYDEFHNMNGEVSIVKYILPANTRVNLNAYKDWVAWGAVRSSCDDAFESHLTTTYYATQKIGSRINTQNIQHCHGPVAPNGTLTSGVQQVGSSSFSWSDGQLSPKKMTDSKWAFHVDHYNNYYVPVTQGVKISVQVFITTVAPVSTTNPTTAFSIAYYPGMDVKDWEEGAYFPPFTKINRFVFPLESNTTPKDHLYTLNITPPFTGTMSIAYGGDIAWAFNNTNSVPLWDKAFTLKDGTSTGTVPVGSFVKVSYEQQYFIKFRDNGLVMQPHIGGESGFWAPDYAPDESALTGRSVKLAVLDINNKDQKWYLQPSSAAGYYNIWTRDGALGSRQFWWHTRSFLEPTLNDPWQQVQFVDQGNGYKKIKLGSKGPGGENIFLVNYPGATQGDSVRIYFDGMDGMEAQLLKADPTGGARYQLQLVHSGKCLGVSGTGTGEGAAIVQVPCNSGDNRQLVNMLDFNTGSGVYKYSFNSSTGKRLDVSGGSTASGAGIVQRTSATSSSQQVTVLDFGNGTYGLSFNHSGLCLDIPSSSTADNAQAKQYACNGGANQRVRFIRR